MRDSEHPQRCSVNRYAVLHFVIESAVDGFASLRKKLGLTAHEMAHLIGGLCSVGVSLGSWQITPARKSIVSDLRSSQTQQERGLGKAGVLMTHKLGDLLCDNGIA